MKKEGRENEEFGKRQGRNLKNAKKQIRPSVLQTKCIPISPPQADPPYYYSLRMPANNKSRKEQVKQSNVIR